jgi:hypothetical protein
MWWVWRARRDEGGALSPEYVGVVVLVAALVTAILLTNPGVSESVAGGFRNAVCTVIGEGCQVAATDGAPDQPPDGGDTDDGDGSGAPPDGEGEDAPADDGQDEPAPAEEDEGFDIVEIARYFGLELLSMVTGLWDLVTQLASSAWRLATDSDYRNQLLEVGRAILDDPLGFLQTLIAGIIEPLQTALEEGLTNEVIGRTLAQGVLAALGLGGARVTSQLSRVVSRLDNDVLRRAARGDGPELCPVGALPAPYLLAAATPILLAADGDCVDAPDNNNNDNGGDNDDNTPGDSAGGPPASAGEALSNPSSLGGRTPDQVQQVFEDAGFTSDGTRGRSGGVRFSNEAAGVHIRYSEGQTGRHFRDAEGSGQPYWHISVANGNPPQLWVGPDGSVYSTPPTYRGGEVDNPGVRLESPQELPPAVQRALGIE